jgi:hypothetical protein
MAEELLLVMGEQEFDYMRWAADRAEPLLRDRIHHVMHAIRGGAIPNPNRWPAFEQCVARLDDRDEVIALIAAQLLRLEQFDQGFRLNRVVEERVEQLLHDARSRPWIERG